MLFWEGVLGQIRTITTTTTTTTRNQQEKNNNKKTTTKKTTTRKQQQKQQQHQQQHTENNNHTNNKTSNNHKNIKQTNNWERLKTRPRKKQKWTKLPPNCSWLKNRAEKRAHPPNASTLRKQAFQKITQNFTKCAKKAFFTHKYSSNCYMHYTAGQCDPKKNFFYKGSTPSDWNRARLSRAEIQVCVSTKLSSWPMGWAICAFLPFFWLPHFSSEMPIFTARNTRGPRTGS